MPNSLYPFHRFYTRREVGGGAGRSGGVLKWNFPSGCNQAKEVYLKIRYREIDSHIIFPKKKNNNKNFQLFSLLLQCTSNP
jgi:hypothetical protein